MNIKLIGSPKVVMTNTESHHAYFAWPTIAKLQNGKICVGASGYRVEHICPFGKGVLAFSDDNGETYSKPIPVFDTVLDDRDVGLTVFGEKGLIATSFNNTLEFQRENMPRTQECFDYVNSVCAEDEAKALGINFRISQDYGETFGKIYKSPVSSPHGPTVLNDGTVLWVGRRLGIKNHIEAHVINTETGEMSLRGKMELYKYEEFKDIYFYEPHAIQLDNGKIICHLRAENKDETLFTLYQTVSLDNGVTWSKPKQIVRDDSGAPGHICAHSSGVLISTFSHRSRPYGIWAIFSEDGGETWSDENVLHYANDTDDLGYPSTIELPNGDLITAFYTKDNDYVPALIMQQKWSFTKSVDSTKIEKHKREATEKWGETTAYKEYAEKTKDYSTDKWSSLSYGMIDIMKEFAVCVKSGATPDSQEAQSLVQKLQGFITENYYTCTNEVLSGLGQLYSLDDRFKKSIDTYGNGTADFISKAIEKYVNLCYF